jgi:hypothetical protein
MGRIFVACQYWSFQFNNIINGRSIMFLLHRSCHPPMSLLLAMDESIISFQVNLKIINNMKLQLVISLHAFAWILFQWWQVYWAICGKWVHYKHLDFILQNVMLCGLMETFIHHPTWSWNEIHKLTSRTRATKVE